MSKYLNLFLSNYLGNFFAAQTGCPIRELNVRAQRAGSPTATCVARLWRIWDKECWFWTSSSHFICDAIVCFLRLYLFKEVSGSQQN